MLSSISRRVRATTHVRCLSTAVATGLNLPAKYGHFIGGKFVEPASGEYFDNVSPIDGSKFIQAARGNKADVDKAVKAANDAYWSSWSKASVTERSNMLLKIADIIEANAERLAKIETIDNGKAIRESMAADIPLCVDHFRYFAGVIRAEEGTASEIDSNTLSLCIQEPLGVVGQIIREWKPRPRRNPRLRLRPKPAPAPAPEPAPAPAPETRTRARTRILERKGGRGQAEARASRTAGVLCRGSLCAMRARPRARSLALEQPGTSPC